MLGKLLVDLGKKRFKGSKRELIEFTDIKEQNDFLNALETNPHAFVLGCLMDRRVKSERAWQVPYKIKQCIGGFTFVGKLEVHGARQKTHNARISRLNRVVANLLRILGNIRKINLI